MPLSFVEKAEGIVFEDSRFSESMVFELIWEIICSSGCRPAETKKKIWRDHRYPLIVHLVGIQVGSVFIIQLLKELAKRLLNELAKASGQSDLPTSLAERSLFCISLKI